jgi:hypothetical protein
VTKSIPIEVGVFIAAEIAGAVAYMYDGIGAGGEPRRVVHRDVSPTNVLIGHSGQVKLIDFGIARQGLTVVDQGGMRPGKVTYMSPEQVKGAPVDGRSDIFCLGTILYEITLGRRLWRGPREVASRRIVEERPKPPTFVREDYPPELELIVLRTLEKRPEDRYQTATELHNDLHNYLERSGAHLRNNCQMADYVTRIFSAEADALISEAGRKRAEAFVDGSELAEPEREDLDFDVQQLDGPGAALARALRASALGIWAEADKPKEGAGVSDGDGDESREKEASVFSETVAELRQSAASAAPRPADAAAREVREAGNDGVKAAENKGKEGKGEVAPTAGREDADLDKPPRSAVPVVVGVVLFIAALVGLFLWLRTA